MPCGSTGIAAGHFRWSQGWSAVSARLAFSALYRKSISGSAKEAGFSRLVQDRHELLARDRLLFIEILGQLIQLFAIFLQELGESIRGVKDVQIYL